MPIYHLFDILKIIYRLLSDKLVAEWNRMYI